MYISRSELLRIHHLCFKKKLDILGIQFSSVTQSCPTICDPINHSTPGPSVPHYLLKFAQVHIHYIGDAIQPFHPLMPSFPSALNLSQHQGFFQWVSLLHQLTKYWSFNLSINPSNEYSGLISLKIYWFDLLAVQGTFGSLLQHPSSKASILWSFGLLLFSSSLHWVYISLSPWPLTSLLSYL